MSCELRPCPFCGGEASHISTFATKTNAIQCDNQACGACIIGFKRRKQAIETWNTRHEPLTEPRALTEEEIIVNKTPYVVGIYPTGGFSCSCQNCGEFLSANCFISKESCPNCNEPFEWNPEVKASVAKHFHVHKPKEG